MIVPSQCAVFTRFECCAVQACDEEKLLGHLGVVLYEYLGEEYPDVLGSILGALKAIVNVIGMTVRSQTRRCLSSRSYDMLDF